MGSVSIQVWNEVHYLCLFNAGIPTQGLPHAKHAIHQPTTAPVATVLFYAFLIMLPFYLSSEHLSCYVGQTELARPTLEQDKNF